MDVDEPASAESSAAGQKRKADEELVEGEVKKAKPGSFSPHCAVYPSVSLTALLVSRKTRPPGLSPPVRRSRFSVQSSPTPHC